MQWYIALLRGINVGGHTVKMERLRALFTELGFTNVATFIASGNVIFQTPADDTCALERLIEEHLRHALGYDVATFIRSSSELVAIANYQAFQSADLAQPDSSLYIAFLQRALTDVVQEKILALRSSVDEFHYHDREIYWLCRSKLSESPLFSGGLFEKAIREPLTMRNITTVRKLAAKYGGDAGEM